ncbi:MAG: hypothetical protein ACLT4C_11030 [Butyricicoccus sp.]
MWSARSSTHASPVPQPDMDEIAAGKLRMMILNRIDLADPA